MIERFSWLRAKEGGEDMPETLTLPEKIIQTWKTSPDLQEEFMGDFKGYIAFMEADSEGKVRIQGR